MNAIQSCNFINCTHVRLLKLNHWQMDATHIFLSCSLRSASTPSSQSNLRQAIEYALPLLRPTVEVSCFYIPVLLLIRGIYCDRDQVEGDQRHR